MENFKYPMLLTDLKYSKLGKIIVAKLNNNYIYMPDILECCKWWVKENFYKIIFDFSNLNVVSSRTINDILLAHNKAKEIECKCVFVGVFKEIQKPINKNASSILSEIFFNTFKDAIKNIKIKLRH